MPGELLWIEFFKVLLPRVLLVSVSVLPLAIGTMASAIHLAKGNAGPYTRNLWGAGAAGAVTLAVLAGALFGTDLSKSKMAGLIFFVAPIYAFVALGIGYGVGALVYRNRADDGGASEQRPRISRGARRAIWLPLAMLGVLMFGIVRLQVEGNDVRLAETSSSEEALRWALARVERGEAPVGVLIYMAQNPNAPADLLQKMGKHDHPSVRLFVAGNRRTDLSVVAGLRDDCIDYVRAAVERRLNLPPGKPAQACPPAAGKPSAGRRSARP